MTKASQEKNFTIYGFIQILDKLLRFCFICIESAEESHCSKHLLRKLSPSIEIRENCEMFF